MDLRIQSQVAAFAPEMGLEQNPDTEVHKDNPERHTWLYFIGSLERKQTNKQKKVDERTTLQARWVTPA